MTTKRVSVPCGPGLDARDDALDARPAHGTIVEFLVAPELVRAWRTGVVACGARFQRLDMPAQRRGNGDVEHEGDPRYAAILQYSRHAVVLDPVRRARIVDAGGQAPGDAQAHLDLTQRQQSAVGREGAAVEADDDRLALDR